MAAGVDTMAEYLHLKGGVGSSPCRWRGSRGVTDDGMRGVRCMKEVGRDLGRHILCSAVAGSDKATHLLPLGPIAARHAHRRVLVAGRLSTPPAPKSVSEGWEEESEEKDPGDKEIRVVLNLSWCLEISHLPTVNSAFGCRSFSFVSWVRYA
jgi:hypothetical protein